jgi:transcription initiation factor TFIIIB Brf1 subunit/transcription initiation factor TFIIB
MPDAPLRCPKCGSNKFVVPDNSTDDSLVICADCRAGIGRWGDIRVGILEEAKTERKGAARRQKVVAGQQPEQQKSRLECCR